MKSRISPTQESVVIYKTGTTYLFGDCTIFPEIYSTTASKMLLNRTHPTSLVCGNRSNTVFLVSYTMEKMKAQILIGCC